MISDMIAETVHASSGKWCTPIRILMNMSNRFPLILKGAPPPNIRTDFRGFGLYIRGVSSMSRIDSNSSVQSDKSTASDSCAAVPAGFHTARPYRQADKLDQAVAA